MVKYGKILLINPPGKCYIRQTDGAVVERKHAQPPLGLAYIAAGCIRSGYDVEVLDILLEGYDNERVSKYFVVYGLDTNDTLDRIRHCSPDVIGISVLFSNIASDAYLLAAAIKDEFPAVPIVFGGHHPSAMPARVLEDHPEVDFVLSGEADLTFPLLVDALNDKVPMDAVRGLHYRDGGVVKDTMTGIAPAFSGRDFTYYRRRDSANPDDLGVLPYPAWDIFNMQGYWACEVRQGGGNVINHRYAVMITTRGCPHVCDFCSSPLMGGYRNHRKRPISDVLGEVRWLVEEFGVREIHFLDDNLFIAGKRAKRLLRALARDFPGMTFVNPPGSEVNALDDEMIELMARAGWKRIIIAIESADEGIQDSRVDKKVRLEQVPRVIRKCRELGLEVRGYFMLGFPGETREQILATAELARSLDIDDFSLSLVSPLPGTPIYDECVEKDILVDSFDIENIRFASSQIRHADISGEELEEIRRLYWLENKTKWVEKQRKIDLDVHRKYELVDDYAKAGFNTVGTPQRKSGSDKT